MNTPQQKEFEYRDQQLSKLEILLEIVGPFNLNATFVDCTIIKIDNDMQRERYYCQFVWGGEFVNDHPGISESTFMSAHFTLARLLVLNGSYQALTLLPNGNYRRIRIRTNGEQPSNEEDFIYQLNGNEISWISPSSRELPVMESRLARRIILHEMYYCTKTTGATITHNASFPKEIIEREFRSLQSSDFIASDSGNCNSTTKGREYYEEHPWRGSGVVFIIASCHYDDRNDDVAEAAHKAVLECYKDKLKEKGYIAIFQEHEEPYKNIYADIWDYLSICDFVIADITHNRPNCYVELGYALAKNRHIVGFMQKGYLENNKIPWDLFPIRFLEYDKDDLAGLKKLLDERIGVVKSRKVSI